MESTLCKYFENDLELVSELDVFVCIKFGGGMFDGV